MLPGIDRPAIASFFPTRRGESVMLDLGANVECDAENLVQFALMGDVFARTVLGLPQPTVGLLNVGSEEMKGNEAVRGAATAAARAGLADPFPRLHRGQRHRRRHGRRRRHRRLHRQHRAQDREGTARLYHRLPARRVPQFADGAARLYLRAAARCASCASGSIPGATTAPYSSASRASASRATAATDALGFANAIGVAVDMEVNGFLDKIRMTELARIERAAARRRNKPQSAATWP